MRLLRAIDNYFFITDEGTAGDRFGYFGGLLFFIGITVFTLLATL